MIISELHAKKLSSDIVEFVSIWLCACIIHYWFL